MELPVEDLSRLPAGEAKEALGRLLNEDAQKPFDLAGRCCARYRLYKLDPANHLLSATFHHIVTDAWSLGVFVAELNRVYQACRRGERGAPLEPLQVEYSDYARWQRSHLRGLRLSKLLGYWTTQLAGAPHVLSLPTDRPRPEDQSFSGTLSAFLFDDSLSAALIALARRQGVTLFMVLLACYYAFLYRYTGQEDILVGAPVANRALRELEPVVGLFVNTLILRVQTGDTQTFEELLRAVQATSLAAFEHQALPFPKLVDELQRRAGAGISAALPGGVQLPERVADRIGQPGRGGRNRQPGALPLRPLQHGEGRPQPDGDAEQNKRSAAASNTTPTCSTKGRSPG